MSPHEIVLAETKPETEWVRGRALQKVSPTYRHGLAQRKLAAALGTWADAGAYGRVASEWRFRVTPPGQITRPLVPDVAYLSFASLAADAPDEDAEVPRCAPTVAVEILSTDDRAADVADKVQTYLAAGSAAVIVVDPKHESVRIHEPTGAREIRAPLVATLVAAPGFCLDVAALFRATSGAL